jgi:triosephosphate isomerase (TIM)
LTGTARKPVIAGNWKMFKTIAETEAFFAELAPMVTQVSHCEMVVAPPFTALSRAAQAARPLGIEISAQDIFWEAQGAFTGEVSAAMLVDAGCKVTLIGHSERRQFFGDTDESVNKKLRAALSAGLRPIVCIGETLAEREAGDTEAVLARQIAGGLAGTEKLTESEFSPILIAYEPVWAIGTGRTATPEIAQSAHAFIRQRIAQQISAAAAGTVRILYGGSVKPDNIKALTAQPDIDGALVGGASLEAKSFAALVHYQ